MLLLTPTYITAFGGTDPFLSWRDLRRCKVVLIACYLTSIGSAAHFKTRAKRPPRLFPSVPDDFNPSLITCVIG